MNDGELVRQALAGQRQAYGELARRWAPRILAVCHARTGNAHVAEDLAQETLLRGLRSLATLKDADKFSSWLCGIATRVCLDWRKSKQSSQVAFSVLGSATDQLLPATERDAAEGPVEREDDVRQLMEHVESLEDPQREALLLFYHQQMSYREIASVLEVSTATVNARLTQARNALRRRLLPQDECHNRRPTPSIEG